MPDNKQKNPFEQFGGSKIEPKEKNAFSEFGGELVTPKKKVATELPSDQTKVSSSSGTQETAEQKPLASSGSEDNIFTGYPGKEQKKYKLQNGMWYEQQDSFNISTDTKKEFTVEGKLKPLEKKTSWKPIENEGRVDALNKVFKQDAYYSKQNKTEEELRKKIIAQQKELKGKGYDVDINGLLEGKTLIAQNKEQAKAIVTEKDKIEKQKMLNSIDAYINSGLIGNEEEQVVSFLRKKFSNQGFIFEESGAGDNLSISYSPDGITKTKTGEISLDNWTRNKDVSEMNKLKTFMKQVYMTTSEKKEILENGNVRNLVSLMAKNPQKYGNELVDKDWFDNHINKSYNTLTLEQKRLNDDYKSLDAKIIKYNENPTPEGLKYIQNKQSELDVRKYAIVKEYGELDKATKNYSKAVGVYAKSKADKGNIIGIISGGLAQGITNIEKMGTAITADVVPYIVDEPVDPITKQEFKASGYTDAQIKDYAAKELKQRILPDLKEGIQNIATLGTTTNEYVQSKDRNDLEKTVNFLSESIGTALSGGGNPILQKIAFFAQSYNAMEDQMMKGQDFEGLSETEKKLVSVPYGIAIGALEKLGFDISAGANATVNNMINKVIAKTFTQLPKDASIELIEKTIIDNVKLSITRGVAKTAAASASEGFVEGAQNLFETGEKFLVNKIEGFDYFKDVPDITTKDGIMKALDAASEDAYYGALGGAIMSGISQSKDYVVNGFNEKLKDDDFYAWVESVSDENLVRASKLNIKDKFRKGEITKDEAKEQLKGIDEAISIVNQIPSEYKVRDKRNAFNLINEKSKLEKEIEGKDKSLVAAQTERINDINEELKAISINNVKTEQDAVKASAEQQQEVPTESNISERKGVDEGQQEVGQGERGERTTEKPSADISDSNITSEEEKVIPSIENKIEEHEQRTENEVVAPNIETTATKKAKSIPRTRKALDVETNDLQDLVKKHFISGGKVNVNSAMQSLFGNKRDKSVASEYRKRIGLHSKGGQTIDGLAHLLWEQNIDTLGESVTTTEWRDAVESVLINEVGTKNMIDSLIAKSEESITDAEAKYWDNKYDMNAIQDFDESELMDAESVLDNMTDEEMAQMYDEIVASEQAEYNPTLDELKTLDVTDKTNLQKVQSFLDNALNDLDSFGKETLGMNLPVAVARVVLKTVKTLVDAGVSLEQAFKQAAQQHNIQEVDIADTLTTISNKKKETEASKAAKNISKKEKTKVTVDEYTALKDQLRLEAKAARESKADLKAKQADLIARFNAMKVRGKMNTNTVTSILNKIKNLNLDNQTKVDDFLEYAERAFRTVDYDNELSKGLKLRKAISKNLKDRSNPFAKVAREFSKLNVKWVTDIKEYNNIAQKIYDSVRNSKFKKDENGNIILDLKQEADLEEVYRYFESERDSQSQRLEDNYRKLYEEATGKSSQGKSINELKSEMSSAKIDYTAEKRNSMKEKLDEFKALSEIDPDVPGIIKEAVNVDLDLLDIKQAVTLLEALDTYFANGTTAKMTNIMGVYRGKYNAKNSKLRASKLRLAGSRKLGKVMNEYLTNLGIISERLFRGHTGGEQFQSESGFTSVYNGANRAEAETREMSDAYFKVFKKVKGFDTIENIYERNVIAFLERSPEVSDGSDFFATRKKLLTDSLDMLSNGTDAEKKMAEMYKKVFDKLDLENAKDVTDILKKSDSNNISAVRYMQQMFADLHPELSQFALDMHNTMLAKDNQYTPDVYKKTDEEMRSNKSELNEDSFAFSNFSNLKLDKSEAGVLIESSRPKSLSNGMFISLDFENNMFNAHRLALTDMYTAEGIRQFDSYMKSDDIKTIIPDSEDRQIIRDAMNGYVNDRKGKTYTDKALISEFKKLTSYFGKLGAFRALGSLRQFPIQYASAVTNALITTGIDKNGVYIDFTAPFRKDVNEFINNSGRAIANRGVDSAISAMKKETDVMPVLNTSGKVVQIAEYPIEKLSQANAKVLGAVLAKADNLGARTMWWAFYKKSLADQGIKLDMNKINDKAADYAQSMTDRQAEVSDTSLRGKVFKSKNPTTSFIKDVLMPFAGFSLNQKNRLYSDFRNLVVGETKEDKIFAARSLAATSGELAITTAIRYQIAKLMVASAASLLELDDDDEEVKEMYDKLDKNNKQNAYSRVIQDIISPNPVFDKYTLEKVNQLMDLTGWSEPDMKKFDELMKEENTKREYKGEEQLTDEEIEKKKQDYILENKFKFYTSDEQDWGYYGILPSKVEETKELINIYRTGKFEKESGNRMDTYYLSESDRKRLKGVVALKLSATVLPAESDMISNKALQIIKEKGMSEAKFEKYEKIKKDAKVTPFMEMLIRETTLSNERIIESSKYAEGDRNLTEKEIKEFTKLRKIYGSDAIYRIKDIKEGKTAKQILGK